MLLRTIFFLMFAFLGGFFIFMGWAYPENSFGWSRDWGSLILLNLLGVSVLVLGTCVLLGKDNPE